MKSRPLPHISIKVVPLLMSGQSILGKTFLPGQIHSQGHIPAFFPHRPVPVKTQTGIACIPITNFLVIRHHHHHRCLQTLSAVCLCQRLIGCFQIGTDRPLSHGGMLLKSQDHRMGRLLCTPCIRHIIQPVCQYITGILFQLHKSKIILIPQLRACF